MLNSLNVKNFALIKNLHFKPGNGLNVITGETGAGKSILLGALGLVLGNRAESSALLNTDEKCVIEAAFDVSALQLKAFFDENDLDYEPICLIRREITPQGKSRAFVNDTPVQLSLLKELASLLIQIHTQNTSLLVTESKEQLRFIDDFASHESILTDYRACFKNWKDAQNDLSGLMQQQAELEKERDFLEFQFQELEDFNPVTGETEELSDGISRFTHAGEIQEACATATRILTDGENTVYSSLAALKGSIKSLRHVGSGEGYLQRLDALMIEVKELSADLEKEGSHAESDPGKLEELNVRLSRLQLLLRKHQQTDSEGLIEVLENLRKQLKVTDSLDEMIEEGKTKVSQLENEVREKAAVLHKSRQAAAESLLAEAEKLLQLIGLPHARLSIQWTGPSERPAFDGLYSADILFSANPGAPQQKLEKAASGGELSRINFCFRTLLAGKRELPTLIYDEADTGISGEVANQMGNMMRKLGQNHQVIAITHLPQVAAAGETHFFVYKNLSAGTANTEIRLLNTQERIKNIAQMLSGKDPGEAAVANARELLGA